MNWECSHRCVYYFIISLCSKLLGESWSLWDHWRMFSNHFHTCDCIFLHHVVYNRWFWSIKLVFHHFYFVVLLCLPKDVDIVWFTLWNQVSCNLISFTQECTTELNLTVISSRSVLLIVNLFFVSQLWSLVWLCELEKLTKLHYLVQSN